MASITEFQARVDEGGDPPSGLDPCLRALWLGRGGDWEGSHDIVNDISTPLGSWIHAWLHRVEGETWMVAKGNSPGNTWIHC